ALEGDLEEDLAAHGAAQQHRPVQLQGGGEGADEVHVVAGGEAGPPPPPPPPPGRPAPPPPAERGGRGRGGGGARRPPGGGRRTGRPPARGVWRQRSGAPAPASSK